MTPRGEFTVTAAAVLFAASLAAGCTAIVPETTSTARATSPTDPSPAQSAQSDQIAPETSSGFPAAPQGAALLPLAVKAGTHGKVERVTVALGGTGTPGYQVQYVAQVVEPGTGKPIDLGADHYLQITLTGVRTPTAGEFFTSGEIANIPADGPIRKIRVLPPVADQIIVVVGIEQRRPFTVNVEQNPTRLVVDVKLS